MDEKEPIVGIACGIFTKEIEKLTQLGVFDFPFIFLDSTLHMQPSKLQVELTEAIACALERFERVLLVYGDCHPYMQDIYDSTRVIRVEGINCCHIMLGREAYRNLRKQGAFFVLNEWAHKWEEIFVEHIGLTEKNAPIFMKNLHEKILYLDTGVDLIPYSTLEEMSKYFDLPYQIIPIPLDFLKDAIQKAYEGVMKNDIRE